MILDPRIKLIWFDKSGAWRVHNCVVCYLGQTTDALIGMDVACYWAKPKNKMSVMFIFNSELASDFQIRVIPKSVFCSVIMKLLSGDIVNTYTTPLINTESTGMNTVWTNNIYVFIEVISDLSLVHFRHNKGKIINIGIKYIRGIKVVDIKVYNI